MGNCLHIDAKTPVDTHMFQYLVYMSTYEELKPFFQNTDEESEMDAMTDELLALELFRELYRSRSREDPAVA